MKNYIRLCALIVAGLSLTACANRPQMQLVWSPTSDATISKDQALTKCSYEITSPQDRLANFDHLFLYSGQPLMTPNGGVQGLSENGISRFRLCMATHGYVANGTEPVPGGAS